jgi:hypothetical protein
LCWSCPAPALPEARQQGFPGSWAGTAGEAAEPRKDKAKRSWREKTLSAESACAESCVGEESRQVRWVPGNTRMPGERVEAGSLVFFFGIIVIVLVFQKIAVFIKLVIVLLVFLVLIFVVFFLVEVIGNGV